MNKEKISISIILLALFLSALVIYMTVIFVPKKKEIHNYFQVYLGGEKIGLIKSDKELYNLIDKEQKDIKEKYNVDKVFSPSGLEVRPVATYSNELMSAREIYDEIKDLDPFTIEGYEVTVTQGKTKTKFYILDKKDLDAAIRKTYLKYPDHL